MDDLLKKEDNSVIKEFEIPPAARQYWMALEFFMPKSFFTDDVSRIGALEIFFRDENGNEMGYIYRGCQVSQPKDQRERLEVTDTVKEFSKTGWGNDPNGNNQHQLKFELDAEKRTFSRFGDHSHNKEFLGRFIEKIQALSKARGATVSVIGYGSFHSDGERWVKGSKPQPQILEGRKTELPK